MEDNKQEPKAPANEISDKPVESQPVEPQDATKNNMEGSDALEKADAPDESASDKETKDTKKKQKGVNRIIKTITARLNVYLLAFLLILVLAAIIVFIVINKGAQEGAQEENIQTQELTQEAVENLSSNEATVGDPKQLLTVESNAVFNGKVLVRDGLDVAGPIKVGGELNIPGITVSGKSQFDEVKLNTLSIAENLSVQGTAVIQKNLTVSGGGTFGGSISAPKVIVDEIQLNGDVSFARHIDAGGGTPKVNNGGALGSGGIATISGSDTAGTITLNIGNNATSGNLASVTFVNAFSGNPHVVITPVSNNSKIVSSGTFYLSSRSTTSFTVATTTPLSAGSISFDYVVID